MEKLTEALERKVQAASRGKQVPTKRPTAPGSRSCSQVMEIGMEIPRTLLMRNGLKGLRTRRGNSALPNQSKQRYRKVT